MLGFATVCMYYFLLIIITFYVCSVSKQLVARSVSISFWKNVSTFSLFLPVKESVGIFPHADPTLGQMVRIAEQLAHAFITEDKTEELIGHLGLSEEQQGLLSSFSGSDRIMMMLLLWKQSRKEEPSRLNEIVKDYISV